VLEDLRTTTHKEKYTQKMISTTYETCRIIDNKHNIRTISEYISVLGPNSQILS